MQLSFTSEDKRETFAPNESIPLKDSPDQLKNHDGLKRVASMNSMQSGGFGACLSQDALQAIDNLEDIQDAG